MQASTLTEPSTPTASAETSRENPDSVVLHVSGEIGVKGNNRGMFERTLKQNLEKSLKGLSIGGVSREGGRFVVRLTPKSPAHQVLERAGYVPGFASVALATAAEPTVSAISEEILRLAESGQGSFRIATRRSDKRFPISSPDMNAHVGQIIVDVTGRPVSLDDPQEIYHIEITEDSAFVYASRQKGADGLPVGTAGRIVALTSGGIDSPVAAWDMLHRGCNVDLVHCASVIPDKLDVWDKLTEISKVLARSQGTTRLHMVPFGELQRAIVAGVPADMRMLIYRRLMVKIAERVMLDVKGKAIVTGDSVGQVSSQTLENLRATFTATDWPILCPLAGHSKETIVKRARAIGTYSISIQPGEDCCQYMVARHPVTRAGYKKIRQYDELDVESELSKAVETRQVKNLSADWSAPLDYGKGY